MKNKERLRQQQMARTKKSKAKKMYEAQKEFHAQIGLDATEMLQQFINELKGLMLVPVPTGLRQRRSLAPA